MQHCCVCLQEVKKKKDIYKCNTCSNTFVCKNCFSVMYNNNIHNNCPVCRTEFWYNRHEVLIIFNEPMNITITRNELDSQNNKCHKFLRSINNISVKIKPIIIIVIKIIIYIMVIWSCGFIILSIYYNNIHTYINQPHVMFMAFIVGLMFILVCFRCKVKCESIPN